MTEKRMHPLTRMGLILAELRQMRTDMESWNDNRPEEMPFDVGYLHVAIDACEKFEAAFHAKDWEAAKHWQAKVFEAIENRDNS